MMSEIQLATWMSNTQSTRLLDAMSARTITPGCSATGSMALKKKINKSSTIDQDHNHNEQRHTLTQSHNHNDNIKIDNRR